MLEISCTFVLPSRKNLSELDEIQRYFRQKLARPFPDLGGARQTDTEDPGPSPQGTAPRAVNAEGRQLLEKSNRLVSQVSSLITGECQTDLRGRGGAFSH